MTRSRIADRLRLGLMIASVAVLLAASLALAVYSEHQNRLQATQAVTTQARVLADTVTAALSFGDRAALNEYVNAMEANSELDAVGVFDGQGRRLAGFSRSRLADHLSKVMTPVTAPDRIIVLAPVVQNGEQLGAVYVRDRTEPLKRRISHYV